MFATSYDVCDITQCMRYHTMFAMPCVMSHNVCNIAVGNVLAMSRHVTSCDIAYRRHCVMSDVANM